MAAVSRKIVAITGQTEFGGFEDPAEEEAEIEAGYVWRQQLWSAMRSFVSSYVANGQKGYAPCAAALDRRWGRDGIGRSVSESVLNSALKDSERNHFRAEWLDWFACRSPEVADLMARRVKPTKTPEEELEDLKAEIREESPRRAETIFRRARAR